MTAAAAESEDIMKITTVRGSNDYLPYEMRIRDYLQTRILKTYESCGFERIGTPVMESIENLDKSEGGENLNLIFKIMQRGEKLNDALKAGDYVKLADMGLRYDLTLPLARYYANNKANLLMPFKSIQIDRVFRAERPQKGRLREFVQCDIDIIGSESIACEIELIDTTAKALKNVGITEFTVKVNDRRILRSVLSKLGFQNSELDSVCIVFDKLDKIGIDGVCTELSEKGFDSEIIKKFWDLLEKMPLSLEEIKPYCGEESACQTVEQILKAVEELSGGSYEIRYDMSLVRGQGYYTGTVFEIESKQFSGAIAGGGRYDGLIGKFTGENIPAVGFSIGFERIAGILKESGFEIPDGKKRLVLLFEDSQVAEAIQKADTLRSEYEVKLLAKPKKLGKLLNRLEEQGYYGYLYPDSQEISVLKNKEG